MRIGGIIFFKNRCRERYSKVVWAILLHQDSLMKKMWPAPHAAIHDQIRVYATSQGKYAHTLPLRSPNVMLVRIEWPKMFPAWIRNGTCGFGGRLYILHQHRMQVSVNWNTSSHVPTLIDLRKPLWRTMIRHSSTHPFKQPGRSDPGF
jgi:hypothetical protein